MRKLILLLCACWVFYAPATLAFDACATDAAQRYTPLETRYTSGLLFTIRKCGVMDSFILGTYHTDSARNWSQSQNAVAKLRNASVAIFEILDDGNPNTVRDAMFFPEKSSKNLRKILGEQEYQTLTNILQNIAPMPPEEVERLRPWAAAIMIQMPKREGDGIVLDEKLKNAAKEKHIPLAALETMKGQFAIFADLPESDQLTMARDAIQFFSELKAASDRLDYAYMQGNLRDIRTIADYSFNLTNDLQLRDRLILRLVTDRNKQMATRMEPYLEKGNSFTAIGALHLMGDQGVLTQLEKQGYFIFPAD